MPLLFILQVVVGDGRGDFNGVKATDGRLKAADPVFMLAEVLVVIVAALSRLASDLRCIT